MYKYLEVRPINQALIIHRVKLSVKLVTGSLALQDCEVHFRAKTVHPPLSLMSAGSPFIKFIRLECVMPC